MKKKGTVLGRITGLDPANTFGFGSDNVRKIDKTDATFVDVYHTNIGMLGDYDPFSGQVHGFINGGSFQPGCNKPEAVPGKTYYLFSQ
jgi:hypothetical protein